MKHLLQFVKQRNDFNRVIGKGKAIDLTVAADRQRVADIIDSALSPENLTCDGELSASQVRSRYKELTAVAKELQALDPSVTFYEFN
jgi:chorismate mutase